MPHGGVLLLLACAHLALVSLLVFLLPLSSGLGGCYNLPFTSLHVCPPCMCGVVLWQGRCTTSALVPFVYFESAVDDHHTDPNFLRYGSNSVVIFAELQQCWGLKIEQKFMLRQEMNVQVFYGALWGWGVMVNFADFPWGVTSATGGRSSSRNCVDP